MLAQSDVPSLEAILKGKPQPLRSYSADRVADYSFKNGTLISEQGTARTLGLFTTKSVKFKDNKLIIEGERSTLVQDSSKQVRGVNGKEAMTLRINLQGADLATVLPDIISLLFFSDSSVAVSTLPEQIKDFLPYDVSRTPRAGARWIREGGKWSSVAMKDPKFVLPVPIAMPDPKFSDEARNNKTNGTVIVVFEITDTGGVKDLWLVNFVNGLTEGALTSVRGYRFKPARYDGRSVGTELLVEVHFRIL